ncbi:response regulator [candidate division FCPU426 bacterium]|nr:response regulator [candidate division FCPU426 bacterium]
MGVNGRKYKILIVEDEPEIMELIELTLASDEYELLQAIDGEQGLTLGTTTNPDLILLDIMLPKIDGYEICRRLKGDKKTSGIPVVMLTAFGQKREIEEGFKVKADDYIVKPFEPAKLRQRIKKYFTA